jgi:hypothetical protein
VVGVRVFRVCFLGDFCTLSFCDWVIIMGPHGAC